jgi:hypothetical protein
MIRAGERMLRSLSLDGLSLAIDRKAFSERVYYQRELVSDVSLVRPRLVTVHKFVVSDPPATFEVQTYEPGGWIVFRDGAIVGSEMPGRVWMVVFGVFAVLQWTDFALEGGRIDLAAAIISTTFVAAALLVRRLWTARTQTVGTPPQPH